MKKALIIIILSLMTLSAGFLSPTGVSAYESTTAITSIGLSGTTGSMTIARSDIDQIIVEYTFLQNEILASKLTTIDARLSNGSNYTFTLPFGTLSFKIWRLITSVLGSKYETTPTGSTEFVAGNYSIAAVKTRLKTLYIVDDCITSESVSGDFNTEAAIGHKQFTMYFSVEDALGEPIPIDRILRIQYSYNLLMTSLWFIKTTEAKEVLIEAGEPASLPSWPFIYPSSVVNRIKQANRTVISTGGTVYAWMVDLGTYSYTRAGGDVTIDETTIITLDYMVDGIFYDDVPVVDIPYQAEDIIDITPETIPWYMAVLEWISENWMIIVYGILAIIILTIIAKLLGILSIILTGAMNALKAIFQGMGIVFQIVATVIFYIGKIMFFWIPVGIGRVLYFLFVPASIRKQRQKREVIIYDR